MRPGGSVYKRFPRYPCAKEHQHRADFLVRGWHLNFTSSPIPVPLSGPLGKASRAINSGRFEVLPSGKKPPVGRRFPNTEHGSSHPKRR